MTARTDGGSPFVDLDLSAIPDVVVDGATAQVDWSGSKWILFSGALASDRWCPFEQ